MSHSALRQLLVDKLGRRDAERFSDTQLQDLLDKGYADESDLREATREGLTSPPALLPILIDKLKRAFPQPGERLLLLHTYPCPWCLSRKHLLGDVHGTCTADVHF